MAMRFGLTMFRDGLSKAIRESEFFPDPTVVRAECVALSTAKAHEEGARSAIKIVDDARALWVRERAEEGKSSPVAAVQKADPATAPAQRHTDQEIAAWKAKHVDPQDVARIRERMNVASVGTVANESA